MQPAPIKNQVHTKERVTKSIQITKPRHYESTDHFLDLQQNNANIKKLYTNETQKLCWFQPMNEVRLLSRCLPQQIKNIKKKAQITYHEGDNSNDIVAQ